CDVENPLLGTDGATAVFAPQKGLPDKDLPAMEKALAHAAELLCETKGCKRDTLEEPGTGAAGGIGWGLHVATDATFINGFQLISAWLGLDRKINDADLILTGEGRMDASSTHGKGPWATLQKANKSGKLVHVFAGILTSEILGALPHNVFAHAITPAQMPLEEALANGQKLLEKAVLKI
ncbi:MAG: glycerate kinase, partial [Opitutae bacterium]